MVCGLGCSFAGKVFSGVQCSTVGYIDAKQDTLALSVKSGLVNDVMKERVQNALDLIADCQRRVKRIYLDTERMPIEDAKSIILQAVDTANTTKPVLSKLKALRG